LTRQGPLSVANRRVPGERQTAAFGASLSLPDAPAKVPFTIRFADLRRIADRNLRPGEPPEGQLHRGEGQERIGSPSLSTEAWIFAARHLLAGAGAHLIVFAARFSADLTDWLSRTAAAGLASRPTARATPCAVRTGRLRNAITLELAKDVVDRRSQRKAVAGQIAPLAASAQQTEDGVHSRLQSVLRGRRPGDASGIRGSSCATPLPQIARVSAALPPIYPRVFLRPPPCSPSP